ncbi:MAG TPA: hypothetical protein VFS40_00805 [Gemmatimonadales bacterium]|nr:hypothetical protein [Gemmatimonadales bacterium]
MSDNSFDALSKLAARSVTRRQTLGGLAAMLGGAFLASVTGGRAFAAAPQTCVTCTCGVGNPCNARLECCAVLGKQFPTAQDACSNKCSEHGFKFCGSGSEFHCPRGCPSPACTSLR